MSGPPHVFGPNGSDRNGTGAGAGGVHGKSRDLERRGKGRVGRLVGGLGLVGWWVGGLVGWWVGGLVGWWVGGLNGLGGLGRLSVGWLVGRLVSRFVYWLVESPVARKEMRCERPPEQPARAALSLQDWLSAKGSFSTPFWDVYAECLGITQIKNNKTPAPDLVQTCFS